MYNNKKKISFLIITFLGMWVITGLVKKRQKNALKQSSPYLFTLCHCSHEALSFLLYDNCHAAFFSPWCLLSMLSGFLLSCRAREVQSSIKSINNSPKYLSQIRGFFTAKSSQVVQLSFGLVIIHWVYNRVWMAV